MQLLFVAKVVNGETPEGYKIFGCAVTFTPPKPTAGKFVKRAKKYRYRLTVFALQFAKVFCSFIQILHVSIVTGPAGDDGGYSILCTVPGALAVRRVVHVPAKRIDAAALIGFFYTFLLQLERDAIDVVNAVMFYFCQV